MRMFWMILVLFVLVIVFVCFEFPKPVYGLWNLAYLNVNDYFYPQKAPDWSPPPESRSYTRTWTLQNGITYEHVKVTHVDADSVTITHSNGTAMLKLASLPPDLQSQLNYNPAAATFASNQRAKSDLSFLTQAPDATPQIDYQKISSIKAQMFILLQQADQEEQQQKGSDKAAHDREQAEALQTELEVLENRFKPTT